MEKETLILLDEMICQQKEALLRLARRSVASATDDDLLQPNDFPELEFNPLFRYEEGVLHGIQAAKAAILAKKASGAVAKLHGSEKSMILSHLERQG